MGARLELNTASKAQELIACRPARLHGIFDQEGARDVVENRAKTANTRGDGHAQDEEGVGGRHCPRKAAAYERIRCVKSRSHDPPPIDNELGMYMTGNTLQIFSIFMVFTLFKSPIMAVMGMQRTFAPYETPGTSGRLIGVKIVYILCNLLMLGLGIWKVNGMGLLPTTRSDWLAWESERTWSERAVPKEWL